MAQNNQGILQLLQAEKKASEKVSEARKRKARRLKQAKEEAQAEIERIHKEKDSEFKNVEASTLGDKDKMSAEVDVDTKRRLQEMERQVATNKEKVIQRILEKLYDITPQLHENARLDEEGA